MKNSKKWLISFLHSFVLLLLTALWMNSPNIYDNEASIIKWSSFFRNLVLPSGKPVLPDSYLFIDLSHEKALIPSEDGAGTDLITDRKKLSTFFNVVKTNKKNIKFILCDVFLKGTSEDDQALQESINGIQNLTFAASQTSSGKVEKLNFKLNQGITDYKMSGGKFIKLDLFQNQDTPTLPVSMYSFITKSSFDSHYYPFHFQGNRLCFNYMIVDYKIKPHELLKEQKYSVVRLSELLLLKDPQIIGSFLKDKIIIMGDFENDVHETVFGVAPGSLILLNTYLSMIDGKHLVSWWWVGYLIIVYTLFSRIMLFHISNYKKKSISWLGPLIKSAVYLSICSIISYLIFVHHLQVAFLTVYISGLTFCIQLYKNPKKWQYYFRTKIKEIKENLF